MKKNGPMKTLCLLFAMMLLIFTLAGCTNNAPAPAPVTPATPATPAPATPTPAAANPIKISMGHALSEATPAALLINEFAANVQERTAGRVSIEVFPNSQLGSETEMLEQMQIGSLDSAAIMIGTMQAIDMRMAIEDLPYMWKDIAHARAAYDSEFGEYLANVMEGYGFHKVSFVEWGFRHITNNKRPIVEPADMQGLTIRVAQTKLRVDTFEALGAVPTIMAFSELYGALQQGVVNAQENPLANIVAANFNEVQKYLSLSGHFYNTVMMVIGSSVWDKISPEDQQIILDEGEKLQQQVRIENDAKEEQYIAELESRGMEVTKNVNKEAFKEATALVYDKWEAEYFKQELMDIYRSASGY